jgi:phosphoribosylformimino-5-aminoimidazole carboxamide ribotide isomerase
MIVYPAMDLMGGKAVRLRQGRFDDATLYSGEPADALRRFAKAGAKWAHLVDLDGARARSPRQHQLIASLAKTTGLKLQVGGGFRKREQIAAILDAGVSRVMLGSAAVKTPGRVAEWIDEFGADRLGLAIDVRVTNGIPFVATGGWREQSGATLWDIAARLPVARHLLITDIGSDGMLQGPNAALYREAARSLPSFEIQASGGVSSLEDLNELGTAGVIIGKALWEGRFSLEDALRHARA